jgi:dihydropteroate synthase
MHSRRRFTVPVAHGKKLLLGERTLVMGIINVTPDSFSDGGELFDVAKAVEAGMRMVDEGADILDVGGESTRPGAQALTAAEERARVLPVVEELAKRAAVPVSVDTYRASVAEAALGAGAAIINDISGLRYDPALGEIAARHGAGLVLMHMRGRPNDMYEHASYNDVIAEVLDELRESIAFATGAGVAREALIVDPGLGFAKEAVHSYEALARVHAFGELGRPILAGPSRKSFLAKALGPSVAPGARDWGTAAAVTAAALAGVHIVRVHAVAQMAQVVRVADEIRKYHRDE